MLMSNMYDTSMFLVAQSVLSWKRWCSDSNYSCQKLTVEGTWRYLCDSALSTKDRTDLRWCPTHEGSKLSNCPETMGEQEFWATRKVKEKHTLAVVRYSVCDLFFPCEESIWSRQGEFGIRGHHLHDFWRFLRCPCSDLCGASQHEAFVRIFEVLVDTFWQVGFLKTKIWGTCGICVYTYHMCTYIHLLIYRWNMMKHKTGSTSSSKRFCPSMSKTKQETSRHDCDMPWGLYHPGFFRCFWQTWW